MSTPTVNAIRNAFPNARVDFFVGTWSKRMVTGNPNIDNVIDCGNVGAGTYDWADYLALLRRLRQGKYDLCIVLERSVFMTLLPFLAGIPQRVGLDSGGRGFSLTVKVPCGATKHEAELYLDTARAIGADIGNPHLEFYPSGNDVERAKQLLSDAGVTIVDPGGAIEGRPLVAIHPAGGTNPGMSLLAKRWPVERFAKIADMLIDQYDANVLLVGAESDTPVIAEMKSLMQHRAINFGGKTNIGELGAILSFCNLFLGNDTGPMHLAVAVGTPVVAVFGPTDERVYGPYSNESTAVSTTVPCRPCFVNGAARACLTYDCIANIDIDQVWQAVRTRLDTKDFRKSNSVVKGLG